MAQITLTGTASVAMSDGITTNQSATTTLDVRAIEHGTHDVNTTYAVIANTGFCFAYLRNNGSVPIIVRTGSGGGYMFFGIPAGGRLLIPGGGGDDIDGSFAFNAISVRTTSGTGRILAIVGINSTN